jgi:hypothetical protein
VQNVEALDDKDEPIHFDDPGAMKFDIAGAMAKVMGVEQAHAASCRMFGLISNAVVIPETRYGFKYLVDWWDSATATMFESAKRRLETFAVGR